MDRANSIFTDLLNRTRQKQGYKPSGVLSVESLESRVLLTTLVLPKGDTGTTEFVYSDPEETSSGDVSAFNVLRIGTLSGQGPSQDVVVEILGYDYLTQTGTPRTVDIPGNIIHSDGTTEIVGGGPGGGPIFRLLDGTTYNVSAMATDTSGNTFGLSSNGLLLRYEMGANDATATVVAPVIDSNNPYQGNITFNGFYSADFAWAMVDYDEDGDGDFDLKIKKEVIYAVVNAPLISDTGFNSGTGPVLITIDPITGEAEPVSTVGGRASYELSNIADFRIIPETGERVPSTISTMIFSEEGHNASEDTIYPTFVGYNQTTNRFISMEVEYNSVTQDTSLAYRNITYLTTDDADLVVSGLAYCDYNSDGDSDLFATMYTLNDDGERSDAKISLVTLNGLDDVFLGYHNYLEVVTLGQHEDDGYDQMDRIFSGFTYDEIGQMGYATEDFTGMVYQVNLANLVYEDEEFLIAGNHDIYQMYILSSTPDVYITITRLDDSGYTPTGGEPAWLFQDEDNATDIHTPEAAGGVAIGTHDYIHPGSTEVTYDALTFKLDPDETAPAPVASYGGVWKNGEIRPGIVVEEGNDVGLISIGGSVFGDVVVKDGSIGTFYCGFLGTNSFVVNGDLQNLIVGTDAGGVSESDGVWQPALNAISYDFGQGTVVGTTTCVLEVMGQMSSFYGGGDWGMPVRVWGWSDVSSFPGVYNYRSSDINTRVNYYDVHREMERKVGPLAPPSYEFTYGAFDWIFTNDTPETSQYLGSRGSDGLISVIGSCEAAAYDAEDYYSFGVMAGDELTIKIYSTGAALNTDTGIPAYPGNGQVVGSNFLVYDPNGNLIETAGEIDPLTGNYMAVNFVAEIAGVYTVSVGVISGSLYYRLDIDGVSETSLGGANILGRTRSNYTVAVRDLTEYDVRPLVQVMNGNLGAINVNGHAAMPQIKVLKGDIKAVRFNGAEDQGFGYASVGIEIDDNGNASDGIEPMVLASGSVGEVRVAGMSILDVYAGDDLQSFYAGADVAAGLYINDDIGSVYVGGNYIDNIRLSSYIFANADGDNNPGIIDNIVVEGYMMAYVSTGRDKLYNQTPSGAGNVRYVYVGNRGVLDSNVWVEDLVAEKTWNRGQSVSITDDSGAEVVLSPGYLGTEEWVVDEEDGSRELVNLDGGYLTTRIMPVYFALPSDVLNGSINSYGKANVIVEVASTDGLRISTRSGAPVEIGLVDVEGLYDDSIVISGSAPISIYRLEAQSTAAEDENTGGDAQEEDDEETPGITTITNSSGWYLNQYGEVYTGRGDQKKVSYVGGDIVSMMIGDIALATVDTDAVDENGNPVTGLSDEELAALLEQDYSIEQISIRGNLGYTASTTGQAVFAPLVYAAVDQFVTPGGSMYNGLYSQVSIDSLKVGGRIANDVYVASSVGSISVNSDRSDYVDQFDGVSAAITIWGNLESINVGDGLIDPGTGFWADAGIFVWGDIGSVKATGLDHDIAGAIIAGGIIGSVNITNGADLEGYNFIGTWNCPNIATHAFFGQFYINHNIIGFGLRDGEYSLGQLLISGEDSEMSGAFVSVGNANKIVIGGKAEGMTNSAIGLNTHGTPQAGTINSISVCGYGIRDSEIYVGYNAKSISVAKGGSIVGSTIYTDWKLGSITADNIVETRIVGGANNINTIGKIIARDSISKMIVSAGSINTVQAKNDIYDSTIYVAGKLNRVKTGDDFVAEIVVGGPYGYLGNITVGGDLGTPNSGSIAVDGNIGTIKVKGNFYSDLYLNESSQYFAGDAYRGYELKSITVGGLMHIAGNVYGDIGTIKTGGNFGVNGDELSIHGDLKSLVVGSGRTSAELQLDLMVDGDLSSVKTTGDIDGDITVTGDLGKIAVNRSVKEAGSHGINGDITVGGDLKGITVKNGDVNGVVNVEGKSGTIKTLGCSIYGTGVYQGDTDGINITGSLDSYYVVVGDVKSIKLTGGTDELGNPEEGSVTEDGAILIDGDLDSLYVSDDIRGMIYVTGNIGTIYVGGDIAGASIVVGGNIGKVTVADEMKEQSVIVVGYDPGSGGAINAADFAKIDGLGTDDYWTMEDWSGESWADEDWDYGYWTQADCVGQVWSNPQWSEIDWTDFYAYDAIQDEITATYLDYIQSEVSAAYLTYVNNKFTIQGHLVDPAEVATAGNIKNVKIKTLSNSSIVAGVAPGTDGVYGDLSGTDKAGSGQSNIGKIDITAAAGSPLDNYGVFADGEIGKLTVAGRTMNIPLQVDAATGFRAWEVPAVEDFDLQAKPGTQLQSFEAGDPLSYTVGAGTINFKLTGNGRALVQIDTATGKVVAMQLKDTDARTSISVTTRNFDDLEVARIFSNDDSSLKSLIIDGTLVYSQDGSSLDIDGGIRTVRIAGIDATGGNAGQEMQVNVDGNIGSLQIGDIVADSDTQLIFNVAGQVNKAVFNSVSTDVYVNTGSLNSMLVNNDFDGNLSSGSLLNAIMVKGDFDGLVFADGNINKVTIKGQMGSVRVDDRSEATISAYGDIKTATTGSMTNASFVAGGSVNSVKVSGDMTGSDIVAGVILDKFTDLRDNELEVAQGDVKKVFVAGNFKESNIAAGVAPGVDGYYSTNDDELNYRMVESATAPSVKSVQILTDGSGTAFDTIVIKLEDSKQENYSNIGNVTIKGTAQVSSQNDMSYAFIASGNIDKVMVHSQRYSGEGAIALTEVGSKLLNSDTINRTLTTMDDVAQSAVWVQVDGLDQQFSTTQAIFQGLSDDRLVYGTDVTVRYDEATNSILFSAPDGFLESKDGANYYKIILRSGLITSQLGVALDGEYHGDMPSGDSQPGGDFVYAFAVADIGELATTAFTPFDEKNGFPSNYFWNYASTLGDNRAYSGSVAMLENDYYKLTNLEEGQVLCINLTDVNKNPGNWQFVSDWYQNIVVELLKVEEHEEYNSYGLSNVIDYNQSEPLVSSEMAEMFWSGSNFYGYDDEGGIFYRIDVASPDGTQGTTVNTFTKLDNDLIDINSTLRTATLSPNQEQGVIESLTALGGHTGDSFWAIANFTPINGTPRQSLVLIRNLERSVDVQQAENLEVYISDTDLSDYNIVGLAEASDYTGQEDYNILYAVSADGRMYQLNSDIMDSQSNDLESDSNYFGEIKRYFNSTVVGGTQTAGQLTDRDGEAVIDFKITGMSNSREGDGLYILHDLALGDYTSVRSDAIYKVTFDQDDNAQSSFWLDLNDGSDHDGLAASPEGYILVGVPMYGSPVGDTFKVTFGTDTQELVFGSEQELALRGGLVNITSDPDELARNYESYAFIRSDMYYGFSIDYNAGLTNDLVITIEDIDFWKTDDNGNAIVAGSMVDNAYSDNPFVNVQPVFDVDQFGNTSTSLRITIDAAYAGGQANVYFSADSGQVLTLSEFSLDKVGKIVGDDTRDAYSEINVRHDTIVPNLTELTVSSINLVTAVTLEADDSLDYNLQRYLSRTLYKQLDGLISDEIIDLVENELTQRNVASIYNDFLAALVMTNYNALGYDIEQEAFVLVNTDTFETRPIIVEAPRENSVNNDENNVELVELTLDSLSRIFNSNQPQEISNGTVTWSIDNITGLEFGAVETIGIDDDEAAIQRPVLWAIATITSTKHVYGEGTESATTQNLIRIDDIFNPDNNFKVSEWNLVDQGLSNITELACGIFADGIADTPFENEELVLSDNKNELYGFDTQTNTLVKFDITEVVIDIDSNTQGSINNDEYGLPEVIGQVESSYVVSAMDFDSKGRLLAVENNGDSIIQI
ncbi:MAG: hypothetical protein JW745_06665, partial [Sedimentisphaerales bacterium]|nr:hypothetical protein [Sedimentisphaerales bacterium]